MMRSSAGIGRINIAASAQRLDVDNRISLRYYYRIADNILKQATIFREENNVIDLYVMLLRYSSLVTETIPCHRDYRTSLPVAKASLKKKLLNALAELEQLKPVVQQKINELNKKHLDQMNGVGFLHQNNSSSWTPVRKPTLTYNDRNKVSGPAVRQPAYPISSNQTYLPARPVDDQFRRLSLHGLRPREETLSRHSILGPDGLHGRWQPPSSYGVQYPSNIDLTPVEIPSLLPVQPFEKLSSKEDSSNSVKEEPNLTAIPVEEEVSKAPRVEEEPLMISFESTESVAETNLVRQPSPPPVLAEVQDVVTPVSDQLAELANGMDNPSREEYVVSETPLQLHISTKLMDSFLRLAKTNTDQNLETCGILAGTLEKPKVLHHCSNNSKARINFRFLSGHK